MSQITWSDLPEDVQHIILCFLDQRIMALLWLSRKAHDIAPVTTPVRLVFPKCRERDCSTRPMRYITSEWVSSFSGCASQLTLGFLAMQQTSRFEKIELKFTDWCSEYLLLLGQILPRTRQLSVTVDFAQPDNLGICELLLDQLGAVAESFEMRSNVSFVDYAKLWQSKSLLAFIDRAKDTLTSVSMVCRDSPAYKAINARQMRDILNAMDAINYQRLVAGRPLLWVCDSTVLEGLFVSFDGCGKLSQMFAGVDRGQDACDSDRDISNIVVEIAQRYSMNPGELKKLCSCLNETYRVTRAQAEVLLWYGRGLPSLSFEAVCQFKEFVEWTEKTVNDPVLLLNLLVEAFNKARHFDTRDLTYNGSAETLQKVTNLICDSIPYLYDCLNTSVIVDMCVAFFNQHHKVALAFIDFLELELARLSSMRPGKAVHQLIRALDVASQLCMLNGNTITVWPLGGLPDAFQAGMRNLCEAFTSGQIASDLHDLSPFQMFSLGAPIDNPELDALKKAIFAFVNAKREEQKASRGDCRLPHERRKRWLLGRA